MVKTTIYECSLREDKHCRYPLYIRCMLAVMLIAALLPLSAIAEQTGVVNNPVVSDRLNLRTYPSASAASLGKFYNGTRVTILEVSNDGQWYRVRIGGDWDIKDQLEGWMMSKYIAVGSAASKVKIPDLPLYYVSVESAALRLYASDSSRAVAKVGNSLSLSVLGISGSSWLYVTPTEATWPSFGFIKTGQVSVGGSYVKGDKRLVTGPNGTKSVNLRAQSSLSAAIITRLPYRTEVTILDESHGQWVRVSAQVNGTVLTGYVMSDYLRRDGGNW